jgi:hypothetical protein
LFNKKDDINKDEEKKQSGEMSRRDFLAGAGVVVAGGAVGGGLLAGCGTESATETIEVIKTKTETKMVEVPMTLTETVTSDGKETTIQKPMTVRKIRFIVCMTLQIQFRFYIVET